jgi:hypothetical protein
MSANDYQIGGNHYKTNGVQHWDLFGQDYLIGCATKYISRWRNKNGKQDLEKALHYAKKLKEHVALGKHEHYEAHELVQEWMENVKMPYTERVIILNLVNWETIEDIDCAIEGIRYLMGEPVDNHQRFFEFGQGTPDDGGHHARQPQEVVDGVAI